MNLTLRNSPNPRDDENVEDLPIPWLLKKCLRNLGVDFCDTQEVNTKNVISMEQCLQFWQTLLNECLMELIQSEQAPILRAVGCDSLGSIGPQIFQQLPRDKQIICITLLFGRTRDEESTVKGAAVRALAICVLYPSLREDPGFVVDTAESIYQTLKDDNVMVRIKASWSLGNLSDALVLNNKTGNSYEEIPDSLILKLLHSSIKEPTTTIK
ncbi:hypothetical protein NQ317_001145 [Molorchus minor]|uniref:HEAT repeat-containing protein 6 n=1 Tax=Molorchus minor TaxID=1323400 RepID=A0ABQ9IZG1_9CUCU|nr:hypothetical protein NQ317_001145 [Molorchus minor]